MRAGFWLRVGVYAMLALSFFVWAIAGIEGSSASGSVVQAAADHRTHASTTASLTTGQKGVAVHGRKEGWLAVVLSVLGVIVVVVFIVGLSSLSVRRRSRDGPPVGYREWAGRWRKPFG
jgi:hypothetical protein